MKRRIFAAVLASAMVLSLAACGGNNNGGGSSSSNPGSSSSANGSASSQPDGSTSADGSNPDGSAGDASQPGDAILTLNRTDIELNKAGATFQLRWTAEPDGIEAFFSSSDEKVATVDGNGVVTAVAPGKAVITVTLGSELAEASCNVS